MSRSCSHEVNLALTFVGTIYWPILLAHHVYLLTNIYLNINKKENNESNINTNLALIYTEWFVNQACSLRNLAPGKYIFSKFDVTPNDIIKFQKLEIINLYLKKDDPQRKEKI